MKQDLGEVRVDWRLVACGAVRREAHIIAGQTLRYVECCTSGLSDYVRHRDVLLM
jgi:hypothetical protein